MENIQTPSINEAYLSRNLSNKEDAPSLEKSCRYGAHCLAGLSLISSLFLKGNTDMPFHQFIQNYGTDIADAWVWFSVINTTGRGFKFLNNKVTPLTAVVASAGAGSVAELYQKAGMLSGTYDPKDFAAYAAGAGLGLLIDSAITRIFKSKSALEAKV